MKTIDPDAMLAVSKRLNDHAAQLKKIRQSLKEDEEVLFPSFTGSHPERNQYDQCISQLNRLSDILEHYSETISTACSMFREVDQSLLI